MCIRDRPVAVLVGVGRDGGDARQAEVEHRDVDAELLAPGAVSYTHLRAHETVLDLVCRLLLEKKK